MARITKEFVHHNQGELAFPARFTGNSPLVVVAANSTHAFRVAGFHFYMDATAAVQVHFTVAAADGNILFEAYGRSFHASFFPLFPQGNENEAIYITSAGRTITGVIYYWEVK